MAACQMVKLSHTRLAAASSAGLWGMPMYAHTKVLAVITTCGSHRVIDPGKAHACHHEVAVVQEHETASEKQAA